MNKNKRNFLVCIILVLLSITFTILVKIVDVSPVGAGETSIGFSSLNTLIFNTLGINKVFFHITEWFGIISIILAGFYALIGIVQLIKRKSILKVDKEIIGLGIFYVFIVLIYLFFEKVIINYRPILIDGILEASYPSSHTLMTMCICGSLIIINKKIFNNKITKLINLLSITIIIGMVLGRLLSGVHWFTDILGGLLISITMLMVFYTSISLIKK